MAESRFGAYGASTAPASASNSQKQTQLKKKNQAQQEPQFEPSRPQVDSEFSAEFALSSGAGGGGMKFICTHYAQGASPTCVVGGGALSEEFKPLGELNAS